MHDWKKPDSPLPDGSDPIATPVKPALRGTHWLIIGIASLCIAIGVAFFAWNAFPRTHTLIGQGDPGPLTQSPPPAGGPTPTPEPGLTIALMGRGGAGHDGGALTDTILIARILEEQKRVVLISIPRDLWVAIPKTAEYASTSAKINFAYAAGGGTLANEIFEKVTGIHVDKYVTIDFSGFEQAIDTIGGVDITVDLAFTDYEYPIAGREDWDCTTQPTASLDDDGKLTPGQVPMPNAISEADLIAKGKLDPTILPDLPKQYPCRYELLDIKSGSQHMDGKLALKYVRSRHSAQDGNDFARSRRQRLLLEAVMDKLVSLNAFTKIPSFLTTLRSHVDTDIATTDILGLIPRANEIRSYPITNLALSTDNYLGQGYTADRQFALNPLTGEGNFTAIKDWVNATLKPSEKLHYPTIEVTSSWKNSSGSATLVKQLIAVGYPAKVGPLVTKNATTSATLIWSNEKIDPHTLETVQQTAGVSKDYFQFASPSARFAPKTDITILLP